MLKVWGRRNSTNVQKVLWCLAELEVPHDRIDAGMEFGIVNTPEFLAKNPNGQVPMAEDGDLVLWESNSIVRYLAAKHGAGGLWPLDAGLRARSDRWMDWVLSQMMPVLGTVFRNLIRTPPERRNQAEIDNGIRRMETLWPMVEGALTEPYLAGDTLTIGDIAIGVCVYRWYGLPIERPELPNLQAYHARLAERPCFREHVMLPLT
jgi:glutathione S-transferase